jgi:hypothetical protein
MQWLRDLINKAVQFRTQGDFFKHRRDGYKALHVICRSNQHGNFLEVSEFHSGSRQSVIRIPEHVKCQGWVNFSQLCKGFWEATEASRGDTQNGVHDKRTRAADESNSRWASRGKQPKSTHKFENSVNVGVNTALGVMKKDANGNNACHSNSVPPLVNASVDLTINLELVCGLGGTWDVAWAKVINAEAHTQAQDKSSLRQVWRPKSIPKVDQVSPQPGPSQTLESSIVDRVSQPRPSITPESSLDSSITLNNS